MANRVAIFTSSASDNVFYFNGDLKAYRVYLNSLVAHNDDKMDVFDDFACTIPVSISRASVNRYQETSSDIPSTGSTTVTLGSNATVNSRGYDNYLTGIKNVTTAGTSVQLSATTVPCSEVTVVAKQNNTGSIFVGADNTVSSTNYGVELKAGQGFTFPVTDVNKLWINASVSGEGASYNAFK